MTTVTLLHPGDMGSAVGEQARRIGTRVLWVLTGRSASTKARAEAAGLTPAPNLASALAESDIVLSICPPAAAEDVAGLVASHDFHGIYVDANAISPQRMQRIAAHLETCGAVPVDGSIFGPPPRGTKTARLYLAGPATAVHRVESLFTGTQVTPQILNKPLGSASALKMAFAGYQKAARALATVSHALAQEHGVTEELTAEGRTMAAAILADVDYLPSVAARAWRWAPEMQEVADSLKAAGLPSDLAKAANSTLSRWNQDKDNFDLSFPEVLEHLRSS
ncbi:NAD(P)-dependent oxidoreductase [Streptomyces sp. YIM 98790]|uniref:NAD(P)-dependent oxidoreductase n=1 Tax=Streptomyces sp. YIM 98790 TaxID=2689077 RepID=UPI00140E4DC2|nr:NAD(P)-dependent oxidoreductase [Streptomyces sp. YIM 98790]